jgi:hypothetical protein
MEFIVVAAAVAAVWLVSATGLAVVVGRSIDLRDRLR